MTAYGVEVQHPCCQARSGGRQVRGIQGKGSGWYCSLPPEHEGEHVAYDLNIIIPGNRIATWDRS